MVHSFSYRDRLNPQPRSFSLSDRPKAPTLRRRRSAVIGHNGRYRPLTRAAAHRGRELSQWAEPPDVLELARSLRVVTALLLRQRPCRVCDGALGYLVETRFFDQQ